MYQLFIFRLCTYLASVSTYFFYILNIDSYSNTTLNIILNSKLYIILEMSITFLDNKTCRIEVQFIPFIVNSVIVNTRL